VLKKRVKSHGKTAGAVGSRANVRRCRNNNNNNTRSRRLSLLSLSPTSWGIDPPPPGGGNMVGARVAPGDRNRRVAGTDGNGRPAVGGVAVTTVTAAMAAAVADGEPVVAKMRKIMLVRTRGGGGGDIVVFLTRIRSTGGGTELAATDTVVVSDRYRHGHESTTDAMPSGRVFYRIDFRRRLLRARCFLDAAVVENSHSRNRGRWRLPKTAI